MGLAVERKTRTAESSDRAGHHPRKVIPYKEFMACKAAEAKALTTSKPTTEDEEDWDEEPPLPPHETLPGTMPSQQSQEDEWKLMISQDPHSRSVTGDSGHGTMAATSEDYPVNGNEKLVGVVGGIDENVPAGDFSDVEWKEDDPLFEFNDQNVTIPRTPDAASMPVQTLLKNKTGSPLKKKPCFCELIAVCVMEATPPLHMRPKYSNTELVGYTQPSLVNVIPWIKYKAQNMAEQTFRHELQCIREVDRLRYIIAVIVWFHQWRQEQGWWPPLPACSFQVGTLATAIIKT